jgi:sulfite reductase (NADPH) hemoprotein beta-component
MRPQRQPEQPVGHHQVSIGGAQGNDASLGKVIGPSFARAEMPDVISRLIETYIEHRHEDERFIDTVRRVGAEPFKTRVYEGRETRRKVANG